MTDILNYDVPFGWLGRPVAGALVRKDVETIFEYRRKEIEKIFS